MRLQPFIPVLLAGALLPACAGTPPVAEAALDPAAAEAAILASQRAALERWSSGDPVGYARDAAPDITYLDDIGATTRLEGRDALLAYLTSLEGSVPVHRFEMVDPKVQLLGESCVLTLHYHATTLDGTPLPPWKATVVYRLDQGTWHMVHAHWSKTEAA